MHSTTISYSMKYSSWIPQFNSLYLWFSPPSTAIQQLQHLLSIIPQYRVHLQIAITNRKLNPSNHSHWHQNKAGTSSSQFLLSSVDSPSMFTSFPNTEKRRRHQFQSLSVKIEGTICSSSPSPPQLNPSRSWSPPPRLMLRSP